MYSFLCKRLLDIIVSTVLLVLLSPLLLLVAIVVPLESSGPVFFEQERVGQSLRSISVLKFRTMTNEVHEVGTKPIIGRATGVTKLGYWLRKFKIDELPQLLSVLRGDLSLVGPRPSVREQLNNMTKLEKSRYDVRPGLTGLAQVSGNIHLTWKERYKKDLEYISNISFKNDFKILLRTALLIVKGEEYFVNKPMKLNNDN
ncbi:sugar transferase [Flagellimonas marinaquae]